MMNTIKYMDKLIASGFTQEQAKGSVDSTVEMMNEKFVSKEDMKDVIHKIELMENRIIVKLCGFVFACFTILAILIKLT